MLRPLPDFTDAERLAKLGKEYALREAWRDALSQLRDSVTALNSDQPGALSSARQAVDRLEQITAHKLTAPSTSA